MVQSNLFVKTRREAPKDEEALNACLLIRAGYIEKVMAGAYSFLPLGFRILKKIENIIREEMEAIGGREILMPALHPKTNWEKTKRWETYDALFKFTSFYSKTDLVLGPTHEEIVSPLMAKFIFSHKDLPQYVFQIQTKFRDEKRAKSGLLRGREFLMKDLYSFHADEGDLDRYYERVKNAYRKIFARVGIGKITYLTFASGGTFSKYSHEFQTISEAGEDTIYLCLKCRVAINKEIIKEQKVCPECKGKNLKEYKSIEVGNIFKLGAKYSKPFNLKYKDAYGKEKDVQMGCYGVGLGRVMGAVAEVSSDEKGLVWPENISPFKVHLLDLGNKRLAQKIYQTLQKSGVEVLFDDREDVSSGEKLVDADLLGISWRAVVSVKTKGRIELKRRDSQNAKIVNLRELLKIVGC